MISCGEGKNTPRNWQLNTCSLHFYISLQLWRMHLRHTRFYPFFHFYFFIFYNHLAILDYEARPISSSKEEKNSRKKFSLLPAYSGSCVVGLDHGSAVGKRKKAPGPSLFLYLVWRTRALLRPDTTFLQQQRGVAASAEEANKETGWAGLDWIGVGHFGNGRGSLVL
ncbi:hypothetical protein HDV62DRAFT_400141 [Trichoderma sp. SZMC 28011]